MLHHNQSIITWLQVTYQSTKAPLYFEMSLEIMWWLIGHGVNLMVYPLFLMYFCVFLSLLSYLTCCFLSTNMVIMSLFILFILKQWDTLPWKTLEVTYNSLFKPSFFYHDGCLTASLYFPCLSFQNLMFLGCSRRINSVFF